jgi:hypothetical protein
MHAGSHVEGTTGHPLETPLTLVAEQEADMPHDGRALLSCMQLSGVCQRRGLHELHIASK